MLNVICLRAGEAFAPEYVTILHDMVRRNLVEGYEGRFICFTDRPQDLDGSGIETRPLPADLPKWWGKLALFKRGLFPEGDRVLYLDLDTVILDRLDDLADYRGPFAALKDFFRPNGLQSSVMAWAADECADIWQRWSDMGCPQEELEGDQDWIERFRPDAVRLQSVFPRLFASYKLTRGIPHHASVCVFHGKPRPHEVTTGWVPEFWKIGGLTGSARKAICNTETAKVFANIRNAMTLDRPWFDYDNSANSDHCVIVGGGPSVKRTIAEIRLRHEDGQHIWALNGAADFLRSHGITPDGHVMVDARPENAEFVKYASLKTEHLIASQCDPAVFSALTWNRVTIWHANMEGVADLLRDVKEKPVHLIGGGTTVGINAIALAYLKGYRKIHLHGFDSCYRDDEHHAYPQALNDGDTVVDAIVGDRRFKAAPWMVQQAEEFQNLSAALCEEGVLITLAGEGLLQHLVRTYEPPMTPAAMRANEVVKRIAEVHNPVGAEVGVFAGDMSARLLDGHKGLKLRMIDSWEGAGAAYSGDSGDWHQRLSQAEQDGFYEHAIRKTAFAAHRRNLIRNRSLDEAGKTEDHSLDFVFIDADHSYDGAKADIWAWAPKVKPGGWLSGHDYMNTDFPGFGVTEAVDEFAAANKLKVELGDNFTWFIQMENT